MKFDFDKIIDRKNTFAIKLDLAAARNKPADAIPLWVADMDFSTAPCVKQALVEQAERGIFGYSRPDARYYDALKTWFLTRHNFELQDDWIVNTPGVVFAIAAAIRAFTKEGDGVLIQKPVYYPFFNTINSLGRRVVNSPLAYKDGRYEIDFEGFEKKVKEEKPKIFLLCSPHNPGGRVWSREELSRLSEICLSNNVIVVSDEIHMDFARPGIEHVPFATLNEQFAQNCVACTSASKTFNLAGLQVANIVIPNKDLRRAFRDEVISSGYSQPNTLGMVATQAAYEHGGSWLDQLKDYLEGNWQLLGEMLEDRTPELQLIEAESTYLAWIDCRALGLDAWQLERFIEDEAKLWLDCGHIFGAGGDGFIRINIATQRSYLERAIDQLASAVEKRRTNL